jgi:hypothetical protein
VLLELRFDRSRAGAGGRRVLAELLQGVADDVVLRRIATGEDLFAHEAL